MDNFTQRIIEFLSHPELPFGGEEDLLALEDPDALRERVASLLEEFPAVLGAPETAFLQAHLDAVAWSFVALEFQARIEATTGFFDGDAKTPSDSAA